MMNKETRVLLVMRDAQTREQLGDFVPLMDSTMQALQAGSLTEALALLERDRLLPAVALLETDLPDSPPQETVQHFREMYPQVPVIALVPPGDDAAGLEALRQGARDYVRSDQLLHLLPHRLSPHILGAYLRSQLEQTEHHIRHIINRNADAILVVDREGYVRFCNVAAEELFGQPVLNLIDSMFGLPLVPEEAVELDIIRPRREPVVAEMRAVETDWNGEAAFLLSLRDITARKRLSVELMQREKMAIALEKERELRDLKNRFLSMMGHELRTPLTSIQLSYDMLRQYGDKATEDERRQYLDNIHTQVMHLRHMVDDVMTLSKSEIAELEFEPELCDLITFCRGVVEEFQLTHHKTHRIEFECEKSVITLAVDRKLLRRALTNLLSNAIKYTPEGGLVRFRLACLADAALIEVVDSGIGIPEEDHPHLFTAFHRARNAERIPGTGLGLAIVKQAVEAHGGSISFESAEGRGTRFSVSLPASGAGAEGWCR